MRILLTGASGLVGQGVLQACLDDPDAPEVVALVRRPLGRTHPRLSELVVPGFDALDAEGAALQPFDACLYCAGAPPLGTPESEYRHVTIELTRNVARALAARNPALRFLYVSGAHADPGSAFMPLRIKGQAEAALAALPLRSVMLRPGGIQPSGGERSPHAVLAAFYLLGAPVMGALRPLLPGVLTSTAHLGRAMLALARMPDPPAVVENREINRLGAG